MANYILIHGSWHGAWCWDEIVSRLEQQGHTAKAVDLPSHGNDIRPPTVVTMEDYVGTIVDALNPASQPSILVCHSMGGPISLAAEAVPDRIRALVFVSGLLTPDGTSMLSAVHGMDPEYLAQMVWAPDGRTAMMPYEGARRFFYHRCSEDLARRAAARFTPEPVAPYQEPIHTTQENFGRVPKFYIECLQDRVIPIAVQRTMQSRLSWKQIFSIDTDHSPFFSAPDQLASLLHDISLQTS